MATFRCIKGNSQVPIGTILVGRLEGNRIILTEASKVLDRKGKPYFYAGEFLPLNGHIWQWGNIDEVNKPDKEELLERFEVAVDVLATYERDILEYGESDIDHAKAEQEYESAKAELLKRLS